MFKSFQQVDQQGEGFDEVVSVDNIAALKKQVPQQSTQQPVQENKKITKQYIKKLIKEVLSEVSDFDKIKQKKDQLYDDMESRFVDDYPEIYGMLPSMPNFEKMSFEEYQKAFASVVPEYAEEIKLQAMDNADKYGSVTGDYDQEY